MGKPKAVIIGYKSPVTGKLMVLSRRISSAGISRYLPKSANEIYISPLGRKGTKKRPKMKTITRAQLKRYKILG